MDLNPTQLKFAPRDNKWQDSRKAGFFIAVFLKNRKILQTCNFFNKKIQISVSYWDLDFAFLEYARG